MFYRRCTGNGGDATWKAAENSEELTARVSCVLGFICKIVVARSGLPNIETAINAYTINAAISLGFNDVTGSIEAGESTDFVVLEKDIIQLAVEEIANTNSLMTILQGEVVFDAEKQ